jgi:hypothetical protein
MYVIIGGGRDLMWQFEYDTYLDTLHAHYQFEEVIVGSNVRDHAGRRKGADAHAKGWADRMGLNTTVMDANWVGHGKGAGPRRNTRMLRYVDMLVRYASYDAAHPGLVIALPGGTGTEDLCMQAPAFSIAVLRWPDLPPELDVAT